MNKFIALIFLNFTLVVVSVFAVNASAQKITNEELTGLFFLKIPLDTNNKSLKQSNLFNDDSFFISKAEDYLIQNKNLFGITSLNNISFRKITTDRKGNKHLRFNKKYQNILIKNSEIIIHFNTLNQIFSINGYQQGLNHNIRLKIDRHLKNGATIASSSKILEQVAKDLKTKISNLTQLNNQAFIILDSPYIIWEIEVIFRSMKYTYKLTDTNPPHIINKTIHLKR